jgi:acetyltransferase-like isoleucine patch superfamily enzyme
MQTSDKSSTPETKSPYSDMFPTTLGGKIARRLSMILVRLNKHLILNGLRMFIYRTMLRMPIGSSSMIWAGNLFNTVHRFTLGANSIIGPRNTFLIYGGISIGNNVNISGFSFFITQYHDVDDPDYKTVLAPITIEDDAWIATNATILAGVTIGRGAVVAAGSVVTKSVDPYMIVAGNPAKPIRERSRDLRYCMHEMRGMKWL